VFADVAYVAWVAALPATPFLDYITNATVFAGSRFGSAALMSGLAHSP
jgi:hypothetical protein